MKWQKWRLVLEGVATLQELEEYYDINDICDANEALDVKAEVERRAMKESQK